MRVMIWRWWKWKVGKNWCWKGLEQPGWESQNPRRVVNLMEEEEKEEEKEGGGGGRGYSEDIICV